MKHIQKLMQLHRLPGILFGSGMRHVARLILIYAVYPVVMRFLPFFARGVRKIDRCRSKLFVKREYRRLQSSANRLIKSVETENLVGVDELGLDDEAIQSIKKHNQKSSNDLFIIGTIDLDGFLLTTLGIDSKRLIPITDESQYIPRNKFSIELVSINNHVGVRKTFRSRKFSFINELQILIKLKQYGCNVPSILDIDFDRCSFTMAYIPGWVLREKLARSGAAIRDRDVIKDPHHGSLTPKQSWLQRIETGRRFLSKSVSSEFIDSLSSEMQKIHSTGVTGFEIKYGNIIIQKKTEKPFWIDFEEAHVSSGRGMIFNCLKEWDIQLFNLHFNTEYLTYKKIKKIIENKQISGISDWYAPAYIGSGLHVGPIWKNDSGFGRWHYILKPNLPQLREKRVLDLGANNGCNALEMLRHGAGEVVGVELDHTKIEQGRFLKEAFECMDNQSYRFNYIRGNMADLPQMDLGSFDVVTAFCSIYYLSDPGIGELIRYIRSITNTMVVQCNHARNINRKDEHTYTKASIPYSLKVLKENGFSKTKVFSPKGYVRPLIVAKRG